LNLLSTFCPQTQQLITNYLIKKKQPVDSTNKRAELVWTLKNDHTYHDIEGIISPDGKTVIVGFKGFGTNSIKMYDLVNKSCVEITNQSMECLCISPDGKLLAYSNNGIITLFDLESHQPIINGLYEHDNAITALCFSHNQKLLAIGTDDGLVIIVDLENYSLKTTLTGHVGTISALCFSPDSQFLASTEADSSDESAEIDNLYPIKLWNLNTHQCKTTLKGHLDMVHNLQFNQDASIVASGSYDGTFRLWDLKAKKASAFAHKDLVSKNPKPVRVCFVDPESKKVISYGSRTIRFWDVATKKYISIEFDDQTDYILTNGVIAVTFSPDFVTVKFYNIR
jgi:WD40 repeat protein